MLTQQPSTYARSLEAVGLLLRNMSHLARVMRPHQARATLASMLRSVRHYGRRELVSVMRGATLLSGCTHIDAPSSHFFIMSQETAVHKTAAQSLHVTSEECDETARNSLDQLSTFVVRALDKQALGASRPCTNKNTALDNFFPIFLCRRDFVTAPSSSEQPNVRTDMCRELRAIRWRCQHKASNHPRPISFSFTSSCVNP